MSNFLTKLFILIILSFAFSCTGTYKPTQPQEVDNGQIGGKQAETARK